MVTRPDAIALLSPGNTEASVVGRSSGACPAANGGTGDVRPAVPGTAPKDTVISGVWAVWVVCGRFAVVVRAIPIRAPLPGVAVHVVESEGVGLELAHRSREHVAVAGLDRPFPVRELRLGRRVGHVRHLGQRLGIVAAVIPCFRSGPAGVFPLGLGRQPVGLAFLAAEPLAEGHRVVPAYVHHRVLVGLLETRVPPGILLVEPELFLLGVPALGPRIIALLRVRFVARSP